jgi:hypothetical protein
MCDALQHFMQVALVAVTVVSHAVLTASLAVIACCSLYCQQLLCNKIGCTSLNFAPMKDNCCSDKICCISSSIGMGNWKESQWL